MPVKIVRKPKEEEEVKTFVAMYQLEGNTYLQYAGPDESDAMNIKNFENYEDAKDIDFEGAFTLETRVNNVVVDTKYYNHDTESWVTLEPNNDNDDVYSGLDKLISLMSSISSSD